jgi:chorismate mutase
MARPDPDHDPVVRELRGRIAETDRAILAAVNTRLRLVGELRAYKLAKGWDFLDRVREEQILEVLARENSGPLTEGGVRELFDGVLALMKRQLAGEPRR